MSTSAQQQMRTRMFARALGPFFTIVPTTVAVRGAYMRTLFTEFQANPMWPWLFGAILLMFGLIIIAFLIFEPDGLAHRWRQIKAYWKLYPFSH